MNARDRLFIFVSAVLVFLFALTVLQNKMLYTFVNDKSVKHLAGPEAEDSSAEILATLKEAGLEPREARYYE